MLTTYRLGHNALVAEIAAHALDQLDLLLGVEARNGRLQDAAQRDLVDLDKGVEVHVGEEAHDELAVHAVRHAAVAGDGVAKVLDLEGALEAGGEEAAKGSNERGKGGEGESVQLHRHKCQGEAGVGRQEEELRQLVGARQEDGVDVAFEAGEDVGAKVLRVGKMSALSK